MNLETLPVTGSPRDHSRDSSIARHSQPAAPTFLPEGAAPSGALLRVVLAYENPGAGLRTLRRLKDLLHH